MTDGGNGGNGGGGAVVTACFIIIGNEILSGRTQDRNLAVLADRLNGAGVQLREVRVIPDVEQTIIDTIGACCRQFDHVFSSGGIGPTHDDITSACVAKAFGVALERNVDAVALLESHYQPGDLTDARLKMADVPVGATLIQNPVSKAPGFRLGNLHVMAGVPSVFRAMVDLVVPTLRGGAPIQSRSLTATLPESRLAPGLGAIQEAHPAVDIGSYPFFGSGGYGVSVVARGTDPVALDAVMVAVDALMRRFGVEPVAG